MLLQHMDRGRLEPNCQLQLAKYSVLVLLHSLKLRCLYACHPTGAVRGRGHVAHHTSGFAVNCNQNPLSICSVAVPQRCCPLWHLQHWPLQDPTDCTELKHCQTAVEQMRRIQTAVQVLLILFLFATDKPTEGPEHTYCSVALLPHNRCAARLQGASSQHSKKVFHNYCVCTGLQASASRHCRESCLLTGAT